MPNEENIWQNLLVQSGLVGVPVSGSLHSWKNRLRKPWIASNGQTRIRKGWHLILTTETGLQGRGEAILPPVHEGGAGTFEAALSSRVAEGEGREVEWWAAQASRLPSPARMALETALLDLLAKASGRALCRLFDEAARPVVAVNAAAGVLDGEVGHRLAELAGAGFPIAKLKLGVFPLQDEIRRLRTLPVPPGLRLRLDANRAWSQEEAEQYLEVLADLPVEGLEEPLADPDPEVLATLQSSVPFPLALDESLLGRYRGVPPAELPAQRLVLKPTALGGLLPALAIARQARQAGRSVVLTSALEGPVGLRAILHLAAAWGEGVHGLATADWFEKPDPELLPRRGLIRLPDGPGLGI